MSGISISVIKDVRFVGENRFKRFFSVANLCDDRDIAFDLEQRGQCAQHHALVFGENHPDLLPAFFRCRSRGR
jgi:hypothetical protein